MEQNYTLTIQLLWKLHQNKLDELSFRFNISSSQLSRYLSGKAKIPHSEIKNIMNFYNYDITQITVSDCELINLNLEECLKYIYFEDKKAFLTLYNQISINEEKIVISGYYISYLLIQERAITDHIIKGDLNSINDKIELVFNDLNPDAKAFHYDNKGTQYMQQRNFELAYSYYKKAESLYSNSKLRYLNYYRLASASVSTKRYSECMHYSNLAMNSFTQEMNLAKVVRLNTMISAFLADTGEGKKAIALLKQCIYIIGLYQLDFSAYELENTIFSIYVERKEYDLALKHIEENTLSDRLYYYLLALMYHDQNDIGNAKRVLNMIHTIPSLIPKNILKDIGTFVEVIIEGQNKKKIISYYKNIVQYSNYITPCLERYFKYIFFKNYINDEKINKLL